MAEVLADPDHHLPLWAPVLRGEEVDWDEVFAGYVAQTDFPGAAFWRELSAAFPDALVVLSTRPAEDWYRSAASTIFQLDRESSPFTDLWRERFGFGDRLDDAAAVIAAYERHNAAVRFSCMFLESHTNGLGRLFGEEGQRSVVRRSRPRRRWCVPLAP
jgi:hypothetical protein